MLGTGYVEAAIVQRRRITSGVPVFFCFPGRSASGEAFTLVELLVVIAILGILAGLLLPVIGRGKDRAIRTVDINNLKQIVTATHIHAAENADVMPWSNWRAGDATDRQGWLYTIDEAAAGTHRFKVESGLLWKTLQAPKLYWCPQDKPTHPQFQHRQQQISSYVMNGAVNGYTRVVYPPLKLAAFSPDAVAFWETDEEEPSFFNDGASRPDEGVSMRHDIGALCATFGGAVSYVKFDDWYREESATNKTRLWCFPDSSDGR